ncbi:MAG: hypothetical protein AABX11_00760 [Nanoarchaeota archaeon]
MIKKGIVLVLVIILIQFAGASLKLHNESITGNYNPGQNISGEISVNISGESLNGDLTSNLGGRIKLFKLMQDAGLESGEDYSCSIYDCGRKYTTTGSNLADQFVLSDKRVIGFLVQGKAISIENIELGIVSDAAPSCSEQLNLDFLDKGDRMIYNNRYYLDTCGTKDYSCFDGVASGAEDPVIIQPGDELCERVTMGNSPAYVLGASVMNSTKGKGTLTMRLYNSEMQHLDECIIPTISKNVEETGCIVDYVFREPKEYYACIASTGGEYKIRVDRSGEICGSNNLQEGIGSYDYEIFAQKMKYDVFNATLKKEFELNYEDDFKQYVNDFLLGKYGAGTKEYTINCTTGCIIPIGMNPGNLSQQINLTSRRILYKDEGNTRESNKLYVLNSEESLLSGNRVRLDLSYAPFGLPNSGKNIKLIISYNGVPLLNKYLNISDVFEFNVNPKFAYPGIEARFVASGTINATKIIWTIEGVQSETTLPEKRHTFSNTGEYSMNVQYFISDGRSINRNFTINVENVSDAFKMVVNQSEGRLNNINYRLSLLPENIRNYLSNKLNISSKGEIVNLIKVKVNQNLTNDEFIRNINLLNELNLPLNITYSTEANTPLIIGTQNLDINLISQISNIELTAEEIENNTNSIVYFGNKYFGQNKVLSRTIRIELQGGQTENVLTYFSIDLNRQEGIGNKTYLLINYPIEQINFLEEYSPQKIELGEENSATAIDISKISKVDFFLESDYTFEQLGVYVAEKIVGKATYVAPKLPLKKLIFYIAMFIFGFLVLYIIIQEWYKKRYQNYLFRNNDDLYNLFSFINNSRIGGVYDGNTRDRLRGFGWSGEQLNYAFKKIDGKKTGMWEIPIFKFFEQRKIRREIAKRQGFGQNTRFIKRPGM